tara:strand:- start:205 stop:393 length:189 start_codon:yes stop_codon:yes gene_type:complete
MFHCGLSVHAKLITMTFEELHVIDDMIYSHELHKYVTIEEYYEEYNSPLNIKIKKYGEKIFK